MLNHHDPKPALRGSNPLKSGNFFKNPLWVTALGLWLFWLLAVAWDVHSGQPDAPHGLDGWLPALAALCFGMVLGRHRSGRGVLRTLGLVLLLTLVWWLAGALLAFGFHLLIGGHL